ncbi:FAD binding domain-containingprotein [Apiospora saccharicola]|uniref:FAD binding domain-containingprotein n=1 Tax=Apiospora saccharicola TaxID=335842 RepID=A0ABR1VLM7_9PEZI
MQARGLIQLLSLAAVAVRSLTAAGGGASCKCFPGDTCWPSEASWAALNDTVGGRLVATVPWGSPCHDPTYDEQACASLRNQWLDSGIHMQSSSSVMAPFFANQSCDPFQSRDVPCTLGNYVILTVNATGPKDIQAAVKFARDHEVRLVIRNTGHDYLDRSTGAGALAVWAHYLKDVQIVDWDDDAFKGKAFRVGAGIQGFEILNAAAREGLVVLTGECPSVGLAGGYLQGGGHSALSTTFGLAADNALSYEVVTAEGALVTASRSENADLYWALSGGGPGNFGVVTAVTVKAHPDRTVSGLSFTLSTTESENVYRAIDAFHEHLPGIVDAGTMVIYFFGASFLNIPGLTAYDISQTQLEKTMAPFFTNLDSLGLKYTIDYTQFPRYLDHYHYIQSAHGDTAGVSQECFSTQCA